MTGTTGAQVGCPWSVAAAGMALTACPDGVQWHRQIACPAAAGCLQLHCCMSAMPSCAGASKGSEYLSKSACHLIVHAGADCN